MCLLQNIRTHKCIVSSTLFLLTFVMLFAFCGCKGKNDMDEHQAMQSLLETANQTRKAVETELRKEQEQERQELEAWMRRIQNL